MIIGICKRTILPDFISLSTLSVCFDILVPAFSFINRTLSFSAGIASNILFICNSSYKGVFCNSLKSIVPKTPPLPICSIVPAYPLIDTAVHCSFLLNFVITGEKFTLLSHQSTIGCSCSSVNFISSNNIIRKNPQVYQNYG